LKARAKVALIAGKRCTPKNQIHLIIHIDDDKKNHRITLTIFPPNQESS
jgi:hypothetical protein